MWVTFANVGHSVLVKVFAELGKDAQFTIIGDDLLVTDAELLLLCNLLTPEGWYEVTI